MGELTLVFNHLQKYLRVVQIEMSILMLGLPTGLARAVAQHFNFLNVIASIKMLARHQLNLRGQCHIEPNNEAPHKPMLVQMF